MFIQIIYLMYSVAFSILIESCFMTTIDFQNIFIAPEGNHMPNRSHTPAPHSLALYLPICLNQ